LHGTILPHTEREKGESRKERVERRKAVAGWFVPHVAECLGYSRGLLSTLYFLLRTMDGQATRPDLPE
jgi:hypothetical protein